MFAPWFQNHVQQPIVDALGDIPDPAGFCSAAPPYGIGIFTARLILSIMILPFISAVTRDVFETVPGDAEGSRLWPGLHHLGSDVASRAALRSHRRGGRRHAGAGPRAGRNHGGHLRDRQCPPDQQSLFAPGTTISATIANEFTEATTTLYTSSLIELGLILFFITFIVLACAQLMLRALERRAGAVA